MKLGWKLALVIGLVAAASVALVAQGAAQARGQAKVDYDKVLGTWSLEINAGEAYYYLTLVLKMDQGQPAGTLSEQNGLFVNVSLANIEYDGQTLKFDCKVMTPPDGTERLTKSEAKLVEGKLQGTISVVDLGLTAPFAGTKK